MARDLVQEAARNGVRLYRTGGRIEYESESPPPEALLAQLRAHRQELLEALSDNGATEPPWIVSSGASGDMRLVVANAPPWPSLVGRAAELVEVLDELHRGDRPEAQRVAEQLEETLGALRAGGIEAWLTS